MRLATPWKEEMPWGRQESPAFLVPGNDEKNEERRGEELIEEHPKGVDAYVKGQGALRGYRRPPPHTPC